MERKAPVPAPPLEIKRHVTFRLRAPRARRVQIAGDFNDWKAKDLSRSGKGAWTVTLPISPGVYAYHFIIDGRRRIKDPNNPRSTPDHKSILTVRGNP